MSQGRNDFIENGVDHLLDIPLKQMRVLTRDTEYQLGFDHDEIPQPLSAFTTRLSLRSSLRNRVQLFQIIKMINGDIRYKGVGGQLRFHRRENEFWIRNYLNCICLAGLAAKELCLKVLWAGRQHDTPQEVRDPAFTTYNAVHAKKQCSS
jgi:hypothetical protein